MHGNLDFCSRDKSEAMDLPNDWNTSVRLIIPPLRRDRWFKSSPPQPNYLPQAALCAKVQRRSIERIAIQSSSMVERSAVKVFPAFSRCARELKRNAFT